MANKRKDPAPAKGRPLTGTVIDVAPENPEVALVQSEGAAINGFIAGAVDFFREATELERAAESHLSLARTWVKPTTHAEDDVLVSEIRKATQEEKAIEEFWTITSVLSRFHKWTVAQRERGAKYARDAKQIGNSLHNQYVADDNRRIARETEDRRLAAERQAREDRAAELAKMDAEALKLEEQATDLSDRESQFVDYIITGFPEHVAATRAGFKAGNDNGAGAAKRLLGLVKVQNAIQHRRSAQAIRQQSAAVKEKPLDVQVEKPQKQFTTAGRSTHGAECVDVDALREAVISGRYDIPHDVLTVDATKLNGYGKDLKELVNRWPGVRYTKKTGVV